MLLKIGQPADHGFDEPLGLLSDCHRRIERFLHILIALTREVAGGELAATQRAQLEAALVYFATAAPRHTADEEESLFPRLKVAGDTAATAALTILERLERDHDAAATHHSAVETIGRQWLSRGHLSETEVSGLDAHLAALQALYQAHIALEDGELFPLAARVLSARQLEEIGGEMAARRRRA